MSHRVSTKHSVTVGGHRTSITLENAFWEGLKEIAHAQNRSVSAIVAEMDDRHPENLSSALRVFVLEYYKNK